MCYKLHTISICPINISYQRLQQRQPDTGCTCSEKQFCMTYAYLLRNRPYDMKVMLSYFTHSLCDLLKLDLTPCTTVTCHSCPVGRARTSNIRGVSSCPTLGAILSIILVMLVRCRFQDTVINSSNSGCINMLININYINIFEQYITSANTDDKCVLYRNTR